jgi:hypothetical protein
MGAYPQPPKILLEARKNVEQVRYAQGTASETTLW